MSDEQKEHIPENAPWWARGIMAVGHAFGVSAILLGFYMGQSAGIIPNPVESELQEIKGVTIRHDAAMQALVKAVEVQGQQLAQDARERQMRCVLRAKTEDEKRVCFPHSKE